MSDHPPCEHASTHGVITSTTERWYCDACGVLVSSGASEELLRLVRWTSWRRWLRRHGIPVPKFMLPGER